MIAQTVDKLKKIEFIYSLFLLKPSIDAKGGASCFPRFVIATTSHQSAST